MTPREYRDRARQVMYGEAHGADERTAKYMHVLALLAMSEMEQNWQNRDDPDDE